MDPIEQREIRDAVVKLEAKMEVMSDSMVSMANSVAKLADMRFEIVGIKKDVANLAKETETHAEEIGTLYEKQRELEKAQDKNTYVVGKIELFWTALITGSAGFFWWLLKG